MNIFNRIALWWDEYRHPRKKCERVGHNFLVQDIRIRKEGGTFGWRNAAVTDYTAKRKYCHRCRHSEPPYDLEEEDSYTSCSMPSDMWREMQKNGYIILD